MISGRRIYCNIYIFYMIKSLLFNKAFSGQFLNFKSGWTQLLLPASFSYNFEERTGRNFITEFQSVHNGYLLLLLGTIAIRLEDIGQAISFASFNNFYSLRFDIDFCLISQRFETVQAIRNQVGISHKSAIPGITHKHHHLTIFFNKLASPARLPSSVLIINFSLLVSSPFKVLVSEPRTVALLLSTKALVASSSVFLFYHGQNHGCIFFWGNELNLGSSVIEFPTGWDNELKLKRGMIKHLALHIALSRIITKTSPSSFRKYSSRLTASLVPGLAAFQSAAAFLSASILLGGSG